MLCVPFSLGKISRKPTFSFTVWHLSVPVVEGDSKPKIAFYYSKRTQAWGVTSKTGERLVEFEFSRAKPRHGIGLNNRDEGCGQGTTDETKRTSDIKSTESSFRVFSVFRGLWTVLCDSWPCSTQMRSPRKTQKTRKKLGFEKGLDECQ